MHEFYFSYGSNLNAGDWSRWCAERGEDPDTLIPQQNAWLVDHRSIYHYYSSSRRGGALDVIPDIGHVTPGTLFAVTGNGWDLLDSKEGAPSCYERSSVIVLTPDGHWQRAITYRVCLDRQRSFIAPTADYAEIVRAGLHERGLPTNQHEQVALGTMPAPLVKHVFVYGLLQSHAALGHVITGGRRQSARIQGRLYDLGDYPGWEPSGDPGEQVHGELVELEDPASTLKDTDRIEDCNAYSHNALYHRVLVQAFTEGGEKTLAWCYRVADPGQAPVVIGGRWR
jgi:gamma-glutamylcyclotransferase (GGCT)/AIG2-like uncharacterized protein YtfP